MQRGYPTGFGNPRLAGHWLRMPSCSSSLPPRIGARKGREEEGRKRGARTTKCNDGYERRRRPSARPSLARHAAVNMFARCDFRKAWEPARERAPPSNERAENSTVKKRASERASEVEESIAAATGRRCVSLDSSLSLSNEERATGWVIGLCMS